MKICKEVLDAILNSMPALPPEVGGIIGGKAGEICIWEFDKGYEEKRCCVYRPNVDHLNRIIAIWIDKGYDFMGIFHVHFGGAKHLSEGDKLYIEKIMKSMPKTIKKLCFPIVVQPERELISYIATRGRFQKIKIIADKVEII